MSKYQERHPRAGHHVFIKPPKRQSHWLSHYTETRGIGHSTTSDTTLPVVLDCCHVSSVKREPLISNDHLNINALGQEALDTLGAQRHVGCVRRSAIKRSYRLTHTQLETLARDLTDITADGTLNSVPAASATRALDAPVHTVCCVKTPARVQRWPSVRRSHNQHLVSVFLVKNTPMTSPKLASSAIENMQFFHKSAKSRLSRLTSGKETQLLSTSSTLA